MAVSINEYKTALACAPLDVLLNSQFFLRHLLAGTLTQKFADGAESVAFFHTHPDVGDVNFSDEMLYGSQLDMSTGKMEMVEMGRAGDKPLARQYGVRIYLGVRPRVFKVFDPNREGAGDGVTDFGRL
ncbi:hypothetical protein [Marinagarivorans algicola]|uniref:hypothetical protein n=1 Tax=Marinagarivorans algicola TaxID=1513270 RepID=UPI003735BAFC